MSWAEEYEEELRKQRAERDATAEAGAAEAKRQRDAAGIIANFIERIECELIPPFLRAADTDYGQAKGTPIERTVGRFITRRVVREGTLWDMAYWGMDYRDSEFKFMGGNDRLWISSNGAWRYSISDGYADDSGRASSRVAIGRDADGLFTPHPPYGAPVTFEHVAQHVAGGLGLSTGSEAIRPRTRHPYADLHSAVEAIFPRIKRIIIGYMAHHHIRPR